MKNLDFSFLFSFFCTCEVLGEKIFKFVPFLTCTEAWKCRSRFYLPLLILDIYTNIKIAHRALFGPVKYFGEELFGKSVTLFIRLQSNICKHIKLENVLIWFLLSGSFNGNFLTKYFDEGSPLITEQVGHSFENKCFLYPRYTALESEFNDTEENVYVKSENISETTFLLYELQFPAFPNYKINIFNSTMTIKKCDKDDSCKLLRECTDAFIESDANHPPLSDDIVYLSWKKKLSGLFLLVQYKEKIKRCSDFNKPLNIHRVVLQSNKKLQFAYTKHSVMTATGENQEILPVNVSLGPDESVYVRISQCSICSMTLRLKCGLDDIDNKIARSDNGPRLLFANSFFIYGWQEIEMSPKKRNQRNNCKLQMFGSYNNTELLPSEVTKFWRATYRLAKGTSPPPPPTTTTTLTTTTAESTQTRKSSTVTLVTDAFLLPSDTTTSRNTCITKESSCWISITLACIFGFVALILSIATGVLLKK
nr:PREDICTED: uncharacterized protein LOC103313789 isoform X2 [Tribolium castaneum]|eukprot:XP_008196179.1 PREDICTED: uncharacterized protein LOC103313789 isoform X2 [Tribolium castaneum]